jgi:hypothetical protein
MFLGTRSRIWVKTWSQIIHDNKSRLKIFQKELNHSADRDASLEYLRKTYARVLQGVESPEERAEVTNSETVGAAEPASSK